MAIIRVKKKKNYTRIDNNYLNDLRLSAREVGVMTSVESWVRWNTHFMRGRSAPIIQRWKNQIWKSQIRRNQIWWESHN